MPDPTATAHIVETIVDALSIYSQGVVDNPVTTGVNTIELTDVDGNEFVVTVTKKNVDD